jgi:hypothetical protein
MTETGATTAPRQGLRLASEGPNKSMPTMVACGQMWAAAMARSSGARADV